MATTQVSKHQAEQSRYYGIKGWLLVFYILMILGALSGLSNAFNEANAMMLGLDMGMWQMISLVQVALMLPFLVLTPMKHRLMPTVSILCLWISLCITVGLFAMNSGNISGAMAAGGASTMSPEAAAAVQATVMIVMIGLSVLFTILFTWYLLASKRVAATFRHRLPESEAREATFGQAHGDPASQASGGASFTAPSGA